MWTHTHTHTHTDRQTDRRTDGETERRSGMTKLKSRFPQFYERALKKGRI